MSIVQHKGVELSSSPSLGLAMLLPIAVIREQSGHCLGREQGRGEVTQMERRGRIDKSLGEKVVKATRGEVW